MVHVHGTDMYGFAVRNIKYPTVMTVHGILHQEGNKLDKSAKLFTRWYQNAITAFNRFFEFRSLAKMKNIIIIAPYVKEMIKNLTSAKMFSIDNPVDELFFHLKNRAAKKRLLFVGLIRARKGLLNLLKALNQVKIKIPHIELHIVGKIFEPDYFEELNRFIKKNDLQKNVSYLGQVDENDLCREFEECAALVLPSVEESSPMVIEQAMAAAKPVIASNVGGIPYLVANNETGILVEYGDVSGLEKAISDLMLDSDRRESMGLKGKKIAEKRFNIKAIAQETREIYLEIAAKN